MHASLRSTISPRTAIAGRPGRLARNLAAAAVVIASVMTPLQVLAQTPILFSRFVNGSNEIFVMDADGSNQTNLTNNANFEDFPRWGPEPQQSSARWRRIAPPSRPQR